LKPDRATPTKATFEEFKATARRLFSNKTFVFNLFAGVFYTFGRNPFYKYQSKYLEVQYKVSSSVAAMITGSVSLVFFSIGLLASGAVISKIKPTARSLAAWNVFTSLAMAIAICSFSFIACSVKSNLEIVGEYEEKLRWIGLLGN
jgi:Organic Anion Transporter Polypeptide (OATP) family